MIDQAPTNLSILRNLEKLRENILSSSSQLDVKLLFRRSSDRIKDVFSKYSSSDLDITSNREIFGLCFECLSLFMKHEVVDPSLVDKDPVEIILDNASINNIIDSFLPQMIRVESVLRSETVVKGPKELGSETEAARVSSVTIALFRMLNVSTGKIRTLRNAILPQISTLLSKIFSFGLSMKLEEIFVGDFLLTCRTIAFAKHNPTKDSLLSILLPHILPWMKKYPDKKFFMHWSNILKNLTLDENNSKPYEARCSQLWFVFHPVLDVIREPASKGITFDNEAVIPCLCFFANLSHNPSRAIEVHDSIKDGLIDGWFEMVKMTKKEDDPNRLASRYWTNLISMLSTVSSIVPSLKCRYDEMMWCSENGGQAASYSLYKCFPYSMLTESKSEILAHKPEILLCLRCLSLFIKHTNQLGKEIYLPISDVEELIDSFIDNLSIVQASNKHTIIPKLWREGEGDEKYFVICSKYTELAVHVEEVDIIDSFLTKITSASRRFLERGSKEKMEEKLVLPFLICFANHSVRPKFKTRSSILTLFKPYVKDWLRVCDNSQVYGQLMIILSFCTLSSNDESPNTSLCSEAWPLFSTVIDAIKTELVGQKIVSSCRERAMLFFANLCCVPEHALEVYENTKDLLDDWFEVIVKYNYDLAIYFWCKLISMFSSVPSLVPLLSPKYDDKMGWCFKNGGWSVDYNRFVDNVQTPITKWVKLVEKIRKCRDPFSTSTLYHEHRDELFSRFISLHSKSEIEEHKQEISLCAQCLNLFVRHIVSGKDIELPLDDHNHLVNTFLDHLARVEEVLKEAVDGEFCCISVIHTFKMRQNWDSFLLKYYLTFKRIFDRGSKEMLGYNNELKFDVSLDLLGIIRNISNSFSPSTKSHIFTLIKPYLKDWLKMYRSSQFYGHWCCILSNITWLDYEQTPNKSLCSEAWPLFDSVLDVVKREFVGDKIVEESHENVLLFFSNLCCNPAHAVEIYDNVKDLLDGWYVVIQRKYHKSGANCWSKLVFMLASVPSLMSYVSPKYDRAMEWCKRNQG
ncbi:hypothetical protein ADUPG1_009222 [Aduncisulcus paluster]|uniref:Uncharacterized protein n=1 Tax=Aduncisulcus paluster TaxID=2918883 RepID=A0ABQ5KUV4_9EUKA|nr:hypothetical protein ADUPG1_009222 [Aduncisulcus paluster]